MSTKNHEQGQSKRPGVENEAARAALGQSDGFGEDDCFSCESSLADLLDGALDREAETRVRAHIESCPGCGTLLRDAEQGLRSMRLLHDATPPMPDDLLGKILRRTTRGVPTLAEVDAEPYAAAVSNVLAFGTRAAPGQREARILMTAAMAFFSIALTLSLAGIRLSDIHQAVRSPGSVGVSASRQFFDTKKQVVSFYDNLRVVREVEATVEELRHSAESDKGKTPQPRLHPSAQRTLIFEENAMPALARLVRTADERKTL